ncbi:methyltransferase domain-containing protein [Polymorphospora rubra]|uniref:Protein-L-isoaspartate O-methyltransferase n=1 Tax=Polymorphospora rubra TaxID=338584 RepID=A0A810MUW2_9ACTN|nr:methyltransferase domain-containing protein [Polymorphospora rubra]BCJ64792.1 protein-L-isoaspartate O-methyltransferase [Polymorphospora rubra]
MDWQHAAQTLAAHLADSGELSDPAWRRAFEQVPRHVFVPDAPLDQVYADQALVTQQRPAPTTTGTTGPLLPTSSSSQPGVMATMLERADIRDGMRVLEIGTATGYNAALLTHRLGGNNVYSVELDPTLHATARQRLAATGHHPHLNAGDGTAGWSDQAPYDRIIATCAVNHIPPAWIDQLHTGGRIVAPLAGAGCALMILDKTADDEVTGRLDHQHVAFMPLRTDVGNPLADRRSLGPATNGIGQYGTTSLDPAVYDHADHDLNLLLQLHLPGLSIGAMDNPRGTFLTLSTPIAYAQVARTATATDGRHTTIQYDGRPWDTAEHVAELWQRLGHPDRGRYGISALNRTDRQYIWLDHPDSPYAWPMPV